MQLARSLAYCLLLGISAAASAQSSATLPIEQYMHQGWDKLSRSTTECVSVVDEKVKTTPVLYLATNESMPAAVKSMQKQCKVDVRRLPRVIYREGDVLPADVKTPGLLYLPNRYVVPGGRFNEMYGWDSYFILLGELADGRLDLARGTVENFFYEIDFYGAILNANRTYYLTRSQPPFLSSMVLAVYRAELAHDPKAARGWLRKALPYLQRDYALWTAEPHLAGNTGLSRYEDLGHGPVPEMSDDSTYYLDIIHWLEKHPDNTPIGYLERAQGSAKCAATEHCLQAEADGLALTQQFFAGDRAMRESGFDTSFRFGPFSGSTNDYAPLCLNALLYKYERDLAFIEATLVRPGKAVEWSSLAGLRLARINELMWDEDTGLYFDYNFVTAKRSTYKFLTSYYMLWAGIASPEQAKKLVANLAQFECEGGLQTSPTVTGVQWDAPFGWAPLQWLTVAGLERYGFHTEARRISQKFMTTVRSSYERDGTVREKYNVETGSSDVTVGTGYKQNVIGFGWTNGVYEAMRDLLADPATAKP